MNKFRLYNLILGWGVFVVALVVYLLTMEPTASFWDCGEFIATAYKLEVGHPPGAPFFMLLGNFFTLFAGGDTSKVAVTVNILSVMASAFTILFLFWTITHLVKKFFSKDEKLGPAAYIAIFGSALVGSLAYTFSDSFWFSAVEAEVYSTSSLFTAVVFWAILKWENVADQPGSNRWIILIAYLMGLSIGVHLLNLLAIPAIVLVYFFRKHKVNGWNIFVALGISIAILGVLNYMLIPGLTGIAAMFERIFVNGAGMPFNSGVLIYVALLFIGLIVGVYLTHNKNVVWNTIFLGLFVIVIGYSSYATIMIRSIANTPLDESNPDTAFSLLSYLNRDQYGDNALIYGPSFNSRPSGISEGKTTFYRGEEDYFKVQKSRSYEYDSDWKMLFPRMWSTQERHINEYMYWGKISEADLYDIRRDEQGNPIQGQMGGFSYDRTKPIKSPTMGQNLRFFFRFHVKHMYWRYFMWNFAGRQNDLQGQGELNKGNWISGINFLDEIRLGPQDELPDSIEKNKARNRYYFLPLILGLLGAVYHFIKNQKDFWVIALLFLLTGLAIVVYLNQYPLQPRERDYAFAGSFYAFAIWIGLGVAALSDWVSGRAKKAFIPTIVTGVSLLAVPGLLAQQNWDDHDRSNRYTAPAFARNFLNSCLPGGIMFTNGDNDTFPLWYLQEVEGEHTDKRVVNLSYLTADWYIEQMKNTYYDSKALPISMTKDEFRSGIRDFVYLAPTPNVLINEKYMLNRDVYEGELKDIFASSLNVLDASLLPTRFAKNYNDFLALEKNLTPAGLYSFLRSLSSEENSERIQVNVDDLKAEMTRLEIMFGRINGEAAPLKEAFDLMLSDERMTNQGQWALPGNEFVIPVDSSKLADWVVPEEYKDRQVDQVKFKINNNVLYKNLLTAADMMATNDWERPIYYSTTVSSDNYLGMQNYFLREGLALRVSPIYNPGSDFLGEVKTDDMYRKLIDEFDWGGLDNPGIYMDENNLRMTIHYRYAFSVLAGALVVEGKNDSAKMVLDECMQHMPEENVPYNAGITPIIQAYFQVGATDSAMSIVEKYEQRLVSELNYLKAVSTRKINGKRRDKITRSASDFLFAVRELNSLRQLCLGFGETETAQRLEEYMQVYGPDYERLFR